MSETANRATAVDMIDGGDRTDEQKAEITRLGQQIANLMANVSCFEVLMDVTIGMVVSAALNTGVDEEFFGIMLAEAMKVFPAFKAGRDARGAHGPVSMQ